MWNNYPNADVALNFPMLVMDVSGIFRNHPMGDSNYSLYSVVRLHV